MIEPVLNFFRGFNDPLKSGAQAARWIAALPTGDILTLQKKALEVVAGFPGARKDINPAQAEALLHRQALEHPLHQAARLPEAVHRLGHAAQAAVLFGLLGYFAGGIGQWLGRHAGAGLWLDRIAGGVLAGLGLRLLVSR